MKHRSIMVIDIGGTHLKFASVCGPDRRTLGHHFPASLLRNSDPIGSLAKLIRQVADELAFNPDIVVSTIPSSLALDRDLVRFAGNIPQLNGHRVATELSQSIGLPVMLERDAIMSLRGEWRAGAGTGVRNLAGLFFGTGVGAAYLQEGIPFRGSGYSLEIGNMPFTGEGRTLEGMRTDCLEAYVSGRVLQDLAEKHGVSIGDVFLAAHETDAMRKDIDDFLRDMAIAVGVTVALFAPDAVLLGGGICEMQGFPKAQLSSFIETHAPYREMGETMDLRWAKLGWEAVLHGAQLTALEFKSGAPSATMACS